jgi:hypothetical protein
LDEGANVNEERTMVESLLKRLGMWAHHSIDRDRAGNAEGFRAWLHRRAGGVARIQVSLKPSPPGVSFTADGIDGEVSGHVVLPRLGVYVGAEGRFVPRGLFRLLGVERPAGAPWSYDLARQCDRTISLSFHDRGVWWRLWMNQDEWRSTDPKWRSNVWRPVDTLLGKSKHETIECEPEAVAIPLPEGMRPATIKWSTTTWQRPRWPFPRSFRSATITPAVPVGIPGKGESAHDCGDDAVHSLTTSARDNEEAIAAFVESVLRSRRRYGGSHHFTPSDITSELPS